MKKYRGLVPGIILAVIMGLVVGGCGVDEQQPTELPTAVPHKEMVEQFVQNDATFLFDGIDGSLTFINVVGSSEENNPQNVTEWEYTVTYQTRHPSEGDRTGQVLAQVNTYHTAEIRIRDGQIITAVCDKTWNMLTDRPAPTTVAGTVVEGGDTTPIDGPQDAPRVFVFKVQRADGTFVNVSYIAYPPSPVGNAARAKIILDFNGGTVTTGDRIDVMGTYQADTNTVIVAEEGDFIRTSPPTP